MESAHANNLLVSYDPNLRLALWPDAAAAKEGMLSVWEQADIIKVSDEELVFLTGKSDIDKAVEGLWHDHLQLMVVTLGKSGSRYYTPDYMGEVSGFNVKSIDTTGAGDGFVAGLLFGLLQHPEDWQEESRLQAICRLANAVGALTTTERGAIPALPTLEKVHQFLQS